MADRASPWRPLDGIMLGAYIAGEKQLETAIVAARFGKVLLGIGLFITGFLWLIIMTHQAAYSGTPLPFSLGMTAIPAGIGFLCAYVFGAIK